MKCELCGKESNELNRFHTVCEECINERKEELDQMLEDYRRHLEED